MSTNDPIILTKTLSAQLIESGLEVSEDSFFNRFCVEQILKDFELSQDELTEGIVDGGDDGGIDGIFSFVNREPLAQDAGPESFGRNPLFEIYIVQSKNKDSFGDLAVQKVTNSLRDLLDLSKEIDTLRIKYNPALLEAMDLFRTKYLEAASRHPALTIHFRYCSKGDTAQVHPKVHHEMETLQNVVKGHFSHANVTCLLLGARELLTESRREKSYTLQLSVLEVPLSRGNSNYVVLTSLKDYSSFVKDNEGKLRSYLFDSNVRDFQGRVTVNKDIMESLKAEDEIDFWWLNNGVTILASNASIAGKRMSLDNVQIVNGLQTTQTIHNYMSSKGEGSTTDSEKSVLVRIIVTSDPIVRDKIIKATNSQTAIPAAYLRASDRIQRDIEQYFQSEGWYYDRRKNYYRNVGKPLARIVGIPLLAQAMAAIVYKEPHIARARPASLGKNDESYNKIFASQTPLKAYLNCIKIVRKFDSVIRAGTLNSTLQERFNFKLHSVLVTVCRYLQSTTFDARQVAEADFDKIDNNLCATCIDSTVLLARKSAQANSWSIERVAKNSEFVAKLIRSLSSERDSSIEMDRSQGIDELS